MNLFTSAKNRLTTLALTLYENYDTIIGLWTKAIILSSTSFKGQYVIRRMPFFWPPKLSHRLFVHNIRKGNHLQVMKQAVLSQNFVLLCGLSLMKAKLSRLYQLLITRLPSHPGSLKNELWYSHQGWPIEFVPL